RSFGLVAAAGILGAGVSFAASGNQTVLPAARRTPAISIGQVWNVLLLQLALVLGLTFLSVPFAGELGSSDAYFGVNSLLVLVFAGMLLSIAHSRARDPVIVITATALAVLLCRHGVES